MCELYLLCEQLLYMGKESERRLNMRQKRVFVHFYSRIFTIEITNAWKKINEREKKKKQHNKMHNNLKALKNGCTQRCCCYCCSCTHSQKNRSTISIYDVPIHSIVINTVYIYYFMNCLLKWQVFFFSAPNNFFHTDVATWNYNTAR